MYVAMVLAQILLKLGDGASNMATRSLLAAWMDAIRALHVDFAKSLGAHRSCNVINCTNHARIQPEYVPISLFYD